MLEKGKSRFLSLSSLKKRRIAAVLLALLVATISYAVISSGDPAAKPLASFFKPIPSGLSDTLQPNVLLLLDTSGSMTFRLDSGNTTYGDGSKPFFFSGGTQYYYGRDVISSNNDPSVELNYHPNLKFVPTTATSSMGSTQRSWLGSSGGQYLYPNDSRMYALKLVLWKIFNDPSLISDLRIGLATYDQYKPTGGITADWYDFPDSSGNTRDQKISWTYSGDYAKLRQGFASTNDPNLKSALMKLFDGEEGTDNEELRAQGGTPLGYSIYSTSGNGPNWSHPSAYSFFDAKDSNGNPTVINAWCQKNWLIVVTDGEDSYLTKDQLVARVKALHDISSSNMDWPIHFGIRSEGVKTLIVGLLDPDTLTSARNTLNAMADAGDDGLQNNSAQAYFVDSVPTLLSALETIFEKIQDRSGSGGAPLVSPARVEGQSSSLYVAKFLPRQQLQWKGYLEKYTLNADGTMPTSPDWEAGTKLDVTAYTARNIYTVDWENPPSGAISGSNLVRMSEGNASSLQNVLDPGNAIGSVNLLSKFIRWFLGSDEFSEGRWKLGDTFHSGLTEVGPPQGTNPNTAYREFLGNNSTRPQVLYVQTNDGLLHAFNVSGDTSTAGKERWGFLPPNVGTFGRLLGLKGYFVKDGTNYTFSPTMTSSKSIPRYTLDGPLVAEDVYVQLAGESTPSWHTILVGCLGYGGTGMYAMDVTNPDKPRFLWAFENVIMDPDTATGAVSDEEDTSVPGSRQIMYWKDKGDGTVSRSIKAYSEVPDVNPLNLRRFLFTVSTPAIGSMKIKENGEWTYKWVAVAGSGSQRGLPGLLDSPVDAVKKGAVYILDIVTGEILDRTFFADGNTNVVTPITVLKTNSVQNIQVFYAGTENGKIYGWNEGNTNDAGHWKETLIFSDDITGPSYRMDVAKISGSPWLFFATGDAEHLVGDPRTASSENNYIASFKGDTGSVLKLNDLQFLDQPAETSTNSNGWYVKLDSNEFPTTPPKIYNGYLFAATFKENPDPCATGTSKLYVMKADTGEGAWGNSKAKSISIQGLKISGITLLSGKAYVGITDYTSSGATLPTELSGAQKGSNVMVFDVPAPASGNTELLPSGQMVPFYWREWKP